MARLIRVALTAVLLIIAGIVQAGGALAADPTPITPGVPFGVQVRDELPFLEMTYTFTGIAGQRVTLSQTGQVPADGVSYQVSNGAEQLNPATITAFGELGVLPASGTWTLTARNSDSDPTDAQATLRLITDTSNPLSFGVSQLMPLTVPGRNQNLTFTGTAGRKIAISVAGADVLGEFPGVDFRLVRPDGSELDDGHGATGPAFFSAVLDVTGRWTLRVDPRRDTTGTITFTVTRPEDQIVSVTPQRATRITLSGTRRDVRLRIPASAGNRITLQVTQASLTSQFGQLETPVVHAALIGPDGAEFGTLSEVVGPVFAEEARPIPSSGTWTVLLQPISDTAGALTVKVGLVADQKISTVLGRANPIAIGTPGQNAVYSFTARAGQHLIATLASQSWVAGATGDPNFAGARMVLLDSQAQVIDDRNGSGDFAEFLRLPQDGRYFIVVDPLSDTTGSATFTVRLPAVTTSPLVLGKPTTATLTRGNVVRYRFDAAPGQRGTVKVTNVSWADPNASNAASFTLYRPDGSTFHSRYVRGVDFLDPDLLDARGVWVLEIDPDGASAGSITFTARQVPDVVGTLTFGQAVTSTITVPGQTARYTFSAKAGDRLAVDTVTKNWTSALGPVSDEDVRLVGPDGTIVNLGAGSPYPNPDSAATWTYTGRDSISTSGTWTLVIDPVGDMVGSKTFVLRKLVTEKAGKLLLGTPTTVTIPSKGAWVEYTFDLTPDEMWEATYDWAMTSSTIAQGGISMIRSDGLTVSGSQDTFGAGRQSGTIQISEPPQTVTFLVQAGYGVTGTATLTVTQRLRPQA